MLDSSKRRVNVLVLSHSVSY